MNDFSVLLAFDYEPTTSVAEFLAFSCHRDSVPHPFGHRISLEVMIEKLLQTHSDVLAVAALLQIMRLIVVLKHLYRFLQAAESHEHLYSLIPGHCAVGIVVHYQQRRLHPVGVEYGRVGDIELGSVP